MTTSSYFATSMLRYFHSPNSCSHSLTVARNPRSRVHCYAGSVHIALPTTDNKAKNKKQQRALLNRHLEGDARIRNSQLRTASDNNEMAIIGSAVHSSDPVSDLKQQLDHSTAHCEVVRERIIKPQCSRFNGRTNLSRIILALQYACLAGLTIDLASVRSCYSSLKTTMTIHLQILCATYTMLGYTRFKYSVTPTAVVSSLQNPSTPKYWLCAFV
jgi:hypothetical protein